MKGKDISEISRREFTRVGTGIAAGLLSACPLQARQVEAAGVVSGEPTAEKAGMKIFAGGGNAVDAAVAAAFVAAVVVPHQTGVGGYGGHMTLALGGGPKAKITCIDFNSIAPAAARGNMFPLDANGKVVGQTNMHGWLAAGVPGILAGLELAAKKFGTRPLGELMRPAIEIAREGFPFGGAAATMRGAANQLAADPVSKALYFRDGKPLEADDHYSNPDVARLLESLAKDNSVESFYRGEIAERIAAAFAANGGLVTKGDLAAYEAREVRPLELTWGDFGIHTAPLTAGGATIVEALSLLKELRWADRDSASVDTAQLQVEAFRQAWQDRLELLGDPQHANVPLERLLDAATIRSVAQQIEQTVAKRQPLPVRVTTRPDQGTINLSVADRQGNLVALTLTHGGSFGARVTVPGLGLTLGHGMSRFDPHPGHPNCPGPHKRPLHNMCPTIVTTKGVPTHAVGARGGRRIPNAVATVLLELVARGRDLKEAVAARRMQTEGTLAVSFERGWNEEQIAGLKQRGYDATTGSSATVSAVARSEVGELQTAMR